MRDTLVEAVRAVPATGKLLYRLVRDDRVDERARLAVMGAAAYAVLPFDIIPDRLPLVGKVDDVVLAAAAAHALFQAAGDEVLTEHWDAAPASLDVLRDLTEAVAGFMPKPLRRLLVAGR